MYKKIILLVLALFICVGAVACTDESDEYTDFKYLHYYSTFNRLWQ